MFNVNLDLIGRKATQDVVSRCSKFTYKHYIHFFFSFMTGSVRQRQRGVPSRLRGHVQGLTSSSASVQQRAHAQNSSEPDSIEKIPDSGQRLTSSWGTATLSRRPAI